MESTIWASPRNGRKNPSKHSSPCLQGDTHKQAHAHARLDTRQDTHERLHEDTEPYKQKSTHRHMHVQTQTDIHTYRRTNVTQTDLHSKGPRRRGKLEDNTSHRIFYISYMQLSVHETNSESPMNPLDHSLDIHMYII